MAVPAISVPEISVGELDPITLQVISGALDTIAEEMGHILFRMSFSSIIRESQDLGAGLFDTDFNTLCESESTPLHIGSLPGYLAGIQETLQGGRWNAGDVVIHVFLEQTREYYDLEGLWGDAPRLTVSEAAVRHVAASKV